MKLSQKIISKFGFLKSQNVVDLVCGMTINPRAALKHIHQNKAYYFCSPNCRDHFAGDPEKYL